MYLWKLLGIYLTIMGALVLLAGVMAAAAFFGLLSLPVLLALAGIYGWLMYAYFHYRFARQEELLSLLVVATEFGLPMGSTLRAYVMDRPHGPEREFWMVLLLFFVFPGYYWFWHRRHRFDARVMHIANLLDQGVPLDQALRSRRGIASREAVLATAVGLSTGHLGTSLRRATSARFTAIWLEVVPRFVYPLLLVLFLSGITTYWAVFLLPKFQKIFADFNIRLPWATETVIRVINFHEQRGWVVALGIQILIVLLAMLILSSRLRWFFPGVGWIYRMSVRGQVLRMLSLLLQAGKPVPEALSILAASGYFGRTVRQRLRAARTAIEAGEPMAEVLRRQGLLTQSMVLLVQAAERARHLPWALGALGEQLGSRTVNVLRRLSMALAPLAVMLVALTAGFGIIGMFVPLVKLIEGLSRQ